MEAKFALNSADMVSVLSRNFFANSRNAFIKLQSGLGTNPLFAMRLTALQ